MDRAKAIEEKDGRLICDFILSNGAVDRDMDTVNPDGWELDNYRKNPVVLWMHDMWQLPVARSLEERLENGQLIGRAEFTSKEENEYGYMVGQLYKQGFLNAVSCRFKGKEWRWAEDESRPFGINFLKQELYEYSCVTIPANPDALVQAKAAGIDVSPAVQVAENILSKGSFDALAKGIAEKVYAAVAKRIGTFDMHDAKAAQDKLKSMQLRLALNKNKGGLH